MKKVMVIAPHPDDETLGAGGSLLKHREVKDKVYWTIVTNIKESPLYIKEQILEREKEIEKVANFYNFEEVYNLNIPPAEIDQISYINLVNKLKEVILGIEPNIIYLPYLYDIHTDHRRVTEAMFSVLKKFRVPFIEKILMMEILSETNFSYNTSFFPNFYVNITNCIDKKIEVLKLYRSEIGTHPFPRSIDSIKSLAILRGSESNFLYAEAFMIVREFWE